MTLKRYTPLRRHTRLSPRGKKSAARRAEKFARNYGSVEHVLAIKSEGCLIWRHNLKFGWTLALLANCHPTILDAAHVKPRKMGGAGGDVHDLVCLCRRHHDEAGEFRTSQRAAFEEHYGVDLVAEAARVAEKFGEAA